MRFIKSVGLCLFGLFLCLQESASRAVSEKHAPLNVFGGTAAAAHQFPYQVGLFLHKSLDRGFSFCGGSVISKNYVLTSARCFRAHNITTVNLLFGTLNFTNSEETTKWITHRVTNTSVIVHENFDRDEGFQNDIALIKLAENLTFSEAIQAVKLPDENDADDDLEGKNGTITGWGKEHALSPSLNYVTVKIISNEECRSNDTGFDSVSENQFCTFGDFMLGICDGDYGGPFVINGTQIGIQSWYLDDHGACFYSQPSVYTKVASFRSWIKEKSNI